MFREMLKEEKKNNTKISWSVNLMEWSNVLSQLELSSIPGCQYSQQLQFKGGYTPIAWTLLIRSGPGLSWKI